MSDILKFEPGDVEPVTDDLEEENIIDAASVGINDPPPDMSSPEWHEYVMQQFSPGELFDGRPKVNALFRMARKLLGDITYSVPHEVQAPCPQNDMIATVIHTIKIMTPKGEITFAGAADVYRGNCPSKKYSIYPSSYCETRAAGRALVKALGLNTVCADEIPAEPLEEAAMDGKILSHQIARMDTMCARLDVDVSKLIKGKTNRYKKIEDMSYADATALLAYVQLFQGDNNKEVPPELKGYNPNWRNDNGR